MKSEFINGDCMEGMKQFPDKYFELAIVDPPYRDAENNRPMRGMRTKQTSMVNWQNRPPAEYYQELFRISKNQIIWGANNFIEHLKNTNCFIFWYKKNPLAQYSDGELAWTSFELPAVCIHYEYYGSVNSEPDRIHPTQKPVELYNRLLGKFANVGDKIIDTHVGSASSLIAFENFGFEYTGFEIDALAFELASKRLIGNRVKIQRRGIDPKEYFEKYKQTMNNKKLQESLFQEV